MAEKKLTSAKKTSQKAKNTPAPEGRSITKYTISGAEQGSVSLPTELFNQKVSPRLIAQALRVYQAELHQGTRGTKTRGEVIGSTRKIYRQKGTGRARHGSITAPVFVGGGIVFGPKPHDPHLSLPKKMRQKALFGLLSQKIDKGEVAVVAGLSQASGKTKEMANLFNAVDQKQRGTLLIVDPTMKKAVRGSRNLDFVTIRPITSLSPLDIARHNYILIAEEITQRFQKVGKET